MSVQRYACCLLLCDGKNTLLPIMSFGKPLFALILLGLAGCASPGIQVRVLVSGGEKITVNMPGGTVVGRDSKELKIIAATFLTSAKSKNGVYVFGFHLFADLAVKSVKVEDVTDAKALTMVEDNAPKMNGREWSYTSPSLSPDDKQLGWVHEIDESLRVYCFRITLNDGRQLKIYHVVYYSPFMKAMIRRVLDIEKI